MLKYYYVNTNPQPNSDHEVHSQDCNHLPNYSNRELLGLFNNCHDAVEEAKKHYPSPSDGCFYCCNPCHHR